MYSVGDGVERNCDRAIFHFKRVAESATWAKDFDRAYVDTDGSSISFFG